MKGQLRHAILAVTHHQRIPKCLTNDPRRETWCLPPRSTIATMVSVAAQVIRAHVVKAIALLDPALHYERNVMSKSPPEAIWSRDFVSVVFVLPVQLLEIQAITTTCSSESRWRGISAASTLSRQQC